jgi:hypothetical protein
MNPSVVSQPCLTDTELGSLSSRVPHPPNSRWPVGTKTAAPPPPAACLPPRALLSPEPLVSPSPAAQHPAEQPPPLCDSFLSPTGPSGPPSLPGYAAPLCRPPTPLGAGPSLRLASPGPIRLFRPFRKSPSRLNRGAAPNSDIRHARSPPPSRGRGLRHRIHCRAHFLRFGHPPIRRGLSLLSHLQTPLP